MKSLGLCACLLLTACQTFHAPHGSLVAADGKRTVVPEYGVSCADAIQVGDSAGHVCAVADPSAPAWDIVETRLHGNRVHYTLRLQYLHFGGEGEARSVLARRAQALAAERGLRGYRIERYDEAIESTFFLPHRAVRAEVTLLPAAP